MRECGWWNCTGRKRNTVCMCLCRRWVTGERDNGVENRMQQVMGVYSIGSEVAKPFLTSGFRTHRRNIKPFRPLNKKFNWFTILPLGLTHIHVVCHPCFPALEYPVLLLRKCDETGVCFLRSKIKGKCWSHVRKHIRTERTNDVVLLRRDEWASMWNLFLQFHCLCSIPACLSFSPRSSVSLIPSLSKLVELHRFGFFNINV